MNPNQSDENNAIIAANAIICPGCQLPGNKVCTKCLYSNWTHSSSHKNCPFCTKNLVLGKSKLDSNSCEKCIEKYFYFCSACDYYICASCC